ncbi:MAG: hypothetical protein ACFE9R_03875, partial [Candidatus Hermodarchaeota archaeon]
DPGEFELKAYAYDSSDNDNLDYYWKIFRGESSFSVTDFNSGVESLVKFRVKETALYRGEIRVESGDLSTTATFVINSVIDSNGNGFSNELEEQLSEVNETITAYSDQDSDGYSDLYELSISNTSYYNPDSDYDGLFDCIDPETGIGEFTAGTSPLNWDCDNDGISDGIEVLGWKINSELLGEIVVNSDPCSINSDSDELTDYEEYYAGTDPRNPDSDSDLSPDHLDPYPMKRDGDSDGLLDGLELKLGTNVNSTDSDNDGIKDGDEIMGYFHTNPLLADSDFDFLSDAAEMQNYKVSIEDRYDLDNPVSLSFDVNCEKASAAQIAFMITFGEAIDEPENNKTYGIQNVPELNVSIYKVDSNLLLFNMTTNATRYFSHVVDIRETIENNSLDYRGEYMIRINDTSAGCLLEKFDIDITGYLDPNNPDFDQDGIYDGVEMGLLVKGVDTINFTDYYEYDNLTVDFNADTFDEFYLDIPSIGRVDSANLTLEIVSDEVPEIAGNITIQLIKEEINCSINDAILLNYSAEFDDNSVFSLEKTFYLDDYVSNNTITDFYGSYRFKIEVSQNSTIFDNFTLAQFFLQTDTYVEASAQDSEAWYTNPARSDSDTDGWDDYYEIFTKGTSPLAEDTDGDGIFDPLDINPLKDAVLKISPVSASVPGNYKLKILSSYSMVGEEDSFYFCTTKQKADIYEGPLYNAYFDGTHGSDTELHYYTNINDVRRVLSFDMQLWRVDRYWGAIKKWDKKLVSGQDTFAVQKVGDNEILEIVEYDNQQNVKYRARIKVEVIGVEKSNTIAIYEKNGTIFNGHYQSIERMNVIQLYVNDTPSTSSPFVKGPNNIVIPTSLFTETVLNGYIQNERLNETFFYSSDDDVFKFISVEREGNTEQTCAEIDFIMIRFDITSEDAEKLLDLILTCVVNESLDENNNTVNTNATLYTYHSTKLNGTSAVKMNLPGSVLGLISWFCNFSDSPQGSQPEDFEEWFWKPIKTIGGFMGGLIITIVMLPAIIFALVVLYVINLIVMALLPILAYILWIIIRVVLLVMFYILLALELIVTIATTLILGTILLLMGSIMDFKSSFGLNIIVLYAKDCKASYMEFGANDSDLKFETWVDWIYWEFFDLYIPWISIKTVSNNRTIQESKYSVITDEVSESSEEIEYTPSSGETTPKLSNHGFTELENSKYDFYVSYWDGNFAEPDPNYGVRLHLIAPNGTSLEHYQMDTIDTPDFSNPFGAVFNYTLDLSSFNEGLWHYYFTTKDNSTGEEVVYSVDSYFIGPFTANSSDDIAFLFDSDLINSNKTYYSPEGWINDEFTFSIKYWDIVNGSAPLNVSLCLVPANKTISTGISKTTGVQKFSMQPIVSSPNYTSYVEFSKVINFTDLGYANYEIGTFYHYFEAVTNDSDVIINIDYNDTYLNGPFVKNIENAYVELVSYSPTNSDGVITKDDYIRYYLTFSDYEGLGPSEVPKIELIHGEYVISYNMTSIYNSTDGTERKYFIEVKGEDLEEGATYNVNCSVLYGGVIIRSELEDGFNNIINVFHPAGSILFSLNTFLSYIGAISLASLIAVSCILPVIEKGIYKFIVGFIFIGTVLALLLGTYLPLLFSENSAGLLAFSIACFCILACLSLGFIFKGRELPENFAKIQSKFSIGIFTTMVVSFAVVALFTNDIPFVEFLGDLWIFIGLIFSVIPSLIGIFSLALVANTILHFANPDTSGGFTLKLLSRFKKTYPAGAYKTLRALYISYTMILGLFAILGIIAYGFSLNN